MISRSAQDIIENKSAYTILRTERSAKRALPRSSGAPTSFLRRPTHPSAQRPALSAQSQAQTTPNHQARFPKPKPLQIRKSKTHMKVISKPFHHTLRDKLVAKRELELVIGRERHLSSSRSSFFAFRLRGVLGVALDATKGGRVEGQEEVGTGRNRNRDNRVQPSQAQPQVPSTEQLVHGGPIACVPCISRFLLRRGACYHRFSSWRSSPYGIDCLHRAQSYTLTKRSAGQEEREEREEREEPG